MRTLQLLASAALLALLAVIAYDLHRIAYALGPRGNLETVMMLPYIGQKETHEERDARLKKGNADAQHDLDVIFGRGDLEAAAKPKTTPKPSR